MKKAIATILIIMFVFVYLSICESGCESSDSGHCDICCCSMGCYIGLPDLGVNINTPFVVSKAFICKIQPYQNIFVKGVFHPPEVSV